MTPAPLLTICVPSFNRGARVEALVTWLLATYVKVDNTEIDLVVVDNCSIDDTQARLARISHPRFRLVRRTEHLDTAEENIIRSIPFVRGEYVWFLGDDDVPSSNGLDFLLETLRVGAEDCLIFNSPIIDPLGKLLSLQPLPMFSPSLTAPIGTIIESIGLLFTIAGVSNVVQRTSKLSMEKGLSWLGVSKIYAHVAWIAEANRDSTVTFYNRPLVFYRQNTYSGGHWERVSGRNSVPRQFYWTLGLSRLVSGLVGKHVLTFVQAGRILELSAVGHRYSLLDDMIFKTHEQILLYSSSRDEKQRFRPEELEELLTFFIRCDLAVFDQLEPLRAMYAAATDEDPKLVSQSRSEFLKRFNERVDSGLWVGRFSGRIQGYDVYTMPSELVAVRENTASIREAVLQSVDAGSEVAGVLTGPDYAGLAIRLAEARRHDVPLSTVVEPSEKKAVEAEILPPTAEAVSLRRELRAVRESTSWRITAPLRRMVTLVRQIGRGQS